MTASPLLLNVGLSTLLPNLLKKGTLDPSQAHMIEKLTMKTAVILIFATIAGIATAQEPITVESLKIGLKTYDKATISMEGRLIAVVRHDAGILRVPVTNLPTEIIAKLSPEPPPSKPIEIKELSIRGVAEDSPLFSNVFAKVYQQDIPVQTLVRVNVVQSVGVGVTLAMLEEGLDIVMVLGDTQKRADGDAFYAILQDTGRIQDYTTVLGAKKSVHVYNVKHPITREGMIAMLKAGGTYDISLGDVAVTCGECGGKPVPCKMCNDTGKLMAPQTTHIKW